MVKNIFVFFLLILTGKLLLVTCSPSSPELRPPVELGSHFGDSVFSIGMASLSGHANPAGTLGPTRISVNGYFTDAMLADSSRFFHLAVLDRDTNAVTILCGTGENPEDTAFFSPFDLISSSPCDFLTQAFLDSAFRTGMTLNPGNSPPMVSGNFYADSLICIGSNYDSTIIGREAGHYSFSFSNTDTLRHTIFVQQQSETGSDSTVGETGYLFGEQSEFTIFFSVRKTSDSGDLPLSTISARIFSGTFSGNRILNARIASVLVRKENDTGNRLLPAGTVRVFEEADGRMGRVSEYPFLPSAKRIKGMYENTMGSDLISSGRP